MEENFNDVHLRSRGVYDPDLHLNPPVVLVGLGGVGGYVLDGLVRLGIKQIFGVDYDEVSLHNQGNQPYFPSDLGKLKTVVMAHRYEDFPGLNYTPVEDSIENALSSLLLPTMGAIYITAVHNMPTREYVLNTLLELSSTGHPCWIIDPRLGGQTFELLTVNLGSPSQVEAYRARMFTDSEATPLPCTERGVIDVGYVTASFVVRAVRRLLVDPNSQEFRIFYDHLNTRILGFDLLGNYSELSSMEEEVIDDQE